MNLPNDSVIILESPMGKDEKKLGKSSPTKKKGLRRSLRKAGMARQLLSMDEKCRTPLRTVYQSVLGHQSNGISLQQSPNIKKRLRSSMTPKVPKKRRKREKSGVDETIIILSDDDECKELPEVVSTSDVIFVADSTEKAAKYCTSEAQTRKKKLAVRRTLQRSNTKKGKLNAKSETNRKGHDGDLEIVWSTGDVSESTSTADNKKKKKRKNGGGVKNEPFFVDTTGDASLLLLDSLILDDRDDDKTDRMNTRKSEEKTKKGQKKASRWNEQKLREIVVDGCNVAMLHTPGQGFSEKGLKLVLDYFVERGHRVTIFLPQHKRTKSRKLLEQWYRQSIVVFTPSRKVGQKNITPYDDRYILDYATKCHGIVISSDQYRDLWAEKPEWRETIEKRLLPPTFVGDYVMFPEDPLGRRGPNLDEFLRLS